VDRSCCSAFGLHLHNIYRFPKDVLPAFRCPRISALAHVAAGCDGVNRGYLREAISYVGDSRIAIGVYVLARSFHQFLFFLLKV
jgi:hypothetical protein